MILPSSFTTGLAGFLHQANLSIDRLLPLSGPDDLSDLINFYEKTSKHTPSDVLQVLTQVLCRSDSQEHPLIESIRHILVGSTRVSDTTLYFVEKVLKRLEWLLADRTRWQRKEICDVRLDLAHAANLLESRIYSPSRRKAIARVFHLNHAEHLKVESIEALVGTDWLETAQTSR